MTTYMLEITKRFELPEQDDAQATDEAKFAASAVDECVNENEYLITGKPASVRLIDVSAPDSAGRVVWTNQP